VTSNGEQMSIGKDGQRLLPIILLSAAGFTVLTTEFIIVGLLPAVAMDLHVSIPQAGLLVTLFAFTVAVVGPPLTAHLSRFERKRLFVITMLLFALSNVLAATAPNFWVMAFARFIPALALPVFWSLASDTAVQIMGHEKAGKAVSMVGFGVVLATIFGIPIGTLISHAYGWRTAFGVIACLALGKALSLLWFLPKMTLEQEPVPVVRQMAILRNPTIMGHVLLSLLIFAGMFTAYTYLADTLERIGGFDGGMVGWILLGFGGVGLIGNWLGGRMVDWSPLGATILFAAPMALGIVILAPVVKIYGPMVVALTMWGIAQSALFTVCHARVMKAARATPAIGASLNISGCNIGIGLGAIIGGRVIDYFGLADVGLAAGIVIALAIAMGALLAFTMRTPARCVPKKANPCAAGCET
jgi:MFS transporter, DHA1 family, inner membrane transport protein